MSRPRLWLLVAILTFAEPATAQKVPEAEQSWIRVDYSDILDRRQLSHSGESVETLLERLGGRPVPAPGERPADGIAHSLLDPLLEPYAFVLPDTLDALAPSLPEALVEIGGLWLPGEAQPAWAELLRARRYVVESDGRGRLRLCLPWPGRTRPAGVGATAAAEQAWTVAWPVVRHVFAAERLRLSQGGAGQSAPVLQVDVHAYSHAPEQSFFWLGREAYRTRVTDTRPSGMRPPLDVEGLQRFLESGLQLEGARLDPDGSLRLLGAEASEPPRLLGRPLALADLAIAYRAVFHGGLAEPYMSLDRGFSPQFSTVNYGGRLQDTSLGLVSLLCDIRFKTFSLGLDIVEGQDVRRRVRETVPEFRTHLERLAADPDSGGMAGQQTRLWFYPDNVDLTLSPQGDVLVLRRVRMAAASERVQLDSSAAAAGQDPPWTRATVQAINQDYDALAQFFPEMSDLDQVVRLLSLFSWLKQADADRLLLPELDSLLAAELPAQPTPRTFPQLLAFNALPEPGATSAVEVFDRVDLAEGLERLTPAWGTLPARRRYERAVASLDRQDPQHAALRAELERQSPDRLDEPTLDQLAYRAERLRMHQLVLATLDPARARQLAERQQAGAQLRIFSVGIGGLDLGMSKPLERARGRSLGLTGADSPAVAPTPGAAGNLPRQARERWRIDPALAARTAVPDHGLSKAGAGSRQFGNHRLEVGRESTGQTWTWSLLGADGPEVKSRKWILDANGEASRIERVEGVRKFRYQLEPKGSGERIARPVAEASPTAATAGAASPIPQGLAVLTVATQPALSGNPGESPTVRLRLEANAAGTPSSREADVPRNVLQRLLLGRQADLTPGQPLPGLSPLPAGVGDVRSLMVLMNTAQRARPWESAARPVPGEEDAARIAAALNDWWLADPAPGRRAVVGTDASRSPARWASSPLVRGAVLLWLPPDGFPGSSARLRDELRAAWTAGPVVDALPASFETNLVVVISAEAPGLFAARLGAAAARPALAGKLLGGWTLTGPLRPDLAATLLDEGRLAGVGLGEASIVGQRRLGEAVGALARQLASGGGRGVEQLASPLLWYF